MIITINIDYFPKQRYLVSAMEKWCDCDERIPMLCVIYFIYRNFRLRSVGYGM